MVQIKQINHKEIEKCKISKKSIDTLKEKYSIILECEGERIVGVGFYKSDLLNDLIKGKGELIRKNLINKQSETINKILRGFNLGDLPFGEKVIKV